MTLYYDWMPLKMKHVEGVLSCPSCEDKLKQAHPYLGDWFNTMKKRFTDIHISWSYRGEADQEDAFARGASRCHYPNSKHNATDEKGNPQALALDLFQQTAGQYVLDKMFLAQLAAISIRENFDLVWGGNFPSLGDKDHFEFHQDKQ